MRKKYMKVKSRQHIFIISARIFKLVQHGGRKKKMRGQSKGIYIILFSKGIAPLRLSIYNRNIECTKSLQELRRVTNFISPFPPPLAIRTKINSFASHVRRANIRWKRLGAMIFDLLEFHLLIIKSLIYMVQLYFLLERVFWGEEFY